MSRVRIPSLAPIFQRVGTQTAGRETNLEARRKHADRKADPLGRVVFWYYVPFTASKPRRLEVADFLTEGIAIKPHRGPRGSKAARPGGLQFLATSTISRPPAARTASSASPTPGL